jgi:hypothetical protein
LLSEARVLGIAIESQFHGLVHEESNTFRNIDRLLTSLGFSLFDLEVHRYSRAALPRPFVYSIPAQTRQGQVLWADALYLRDLGGEQHATLAREFPPEKILKLACLFEIFGLQDCAAELLLKYQPLVAHLIDVDACLDMLASEVNGTKISYSQYISGFEQNVESFYPAGTTAGMPGIGQTHRSSVIPFSPAGGYWNQRHALAGARDKILSLCRTVDHSCDLLPFQWAQLMSVVLDYNPDLVIELGRGCGNSTCAFTEASNLNQQRTRVLSLCFSDDWERVTAPRLRTIVTPEWFHPLQALRTDILEFDYAKAIGSAKRVVLFWDAHGFEIAGCVLGAILPLLAARDHLVVMHDLSDSRYGSEEQLEYGGHGLWKGNDWSGPRLKLGIIDSAAEQSVAVVDFTTRNHLTLDSADHSFRTELTPGRQAEMSRILGDLFDLQGHWFYFSLNEKPGPYQFPRYIRPSLRVETDKRTRRKAWRLFGR